MVKRILEACKERSIITLNEHLWIFLLMFFVSATEILLSGKISLLTIVTSISCGLFESVSLFIPCLLLSKRLNIIYTSLLLIIYELSLIIALISYGFYGKVMVSEVCVLFLETNLNEAVEFLTGYLRHVNVLHIILGSVSLVFIVHAATFVVGLYIRSKIGILLKWIACTYLFLLLLVPYHPELYVNIVPLQIKAVLNTRINLSEYIKDAHLERKRDSRPDNIILIIGESHNKNHSSLYGYKKNTNPLLGKRKQNGELYVFDNVVSPATTTIPSFKYMMSTYNYQSKMQWYKEQTLAQIIKESGYTSYWFSNQGKYGFWNNVIVKYAKLFDESFFCDELYTENNEIIYDEEVLTLREKFEIKDRIPKFIVYHLMGSHPDFRLRSPQNFKLFDCDDYVCNNDCYNSQVLAEYDNSIYYNDFVVNSIISCYQDSNSLVIYLSDHALDLFQTDCDYAGHAKANKESTKVGVEIPFWIYVSPKFKKNNPQMVERINNSRNKPFMTDDLIYVIMDIMGVEFKDNPNKVSEHSFLSIKYKNRIRIINGFNIDN